MTERFDLPAIAVLDVAYTAHGAGVACVVAEDWSSPVALSEQAAFMPGTPTSYQPGRFYLRELPLLTRAIALLAPSPRTLLIDAYVWLDREGTPGLGARLYEAIGRRMAVVGIAKTPLAGDDWSAKVLRGAGSRPLRVTAAGLALDEAAAAVERMDGAHRLPTLVKRADTLARRAAVGVVPGERPR